MNSEQITEAEKEFCFYKYGTSGSFMTTLIDAIHKADRFNKVRLGLGFQELVEVVDKFQNEPGYWEDLENRWEKFNKTPIV